ncbi:hypothetical protein PROVRETT_06219 [Providencia rettgeri DSM 1131]|nr:hypothetical protein PROVRETT_06219 [Providencia rettgeri DSM 1131]
MLFEYNFVIFSLKCILFSWGILVENFTHNLIMRIHSLYGDFFIRIMISISIFAR